MLNHKSNQTQTSNQKPTPNKHIIEEPINHKPATGLILKTNQTITITKIK